MLLDDAESCRRKMGAATALIGGLGGEKVRWTQQSKEFKSQIERWDDKNLQWKLFYCRPKRPVAIHFPIVPVIGWWVMCYYSQAFCPILDHSIKNSEQHSRKRGAKSSCLEVFHLPRNWTSRLCSSTMQLLVRRLPLTYVTYCFCFFVFLLLQYLKYCDMWPLNLHQAWKYIIIAVLWK